MDNIRTTKKKCKQWKEDFINVKIVFDSCNDIVCVHHVLIQLI